MGMYLAKGCYLTMIRVHFSQVKKAGGRSQVLRHSLRRCTEHLRAMFGARNVLILLNLIFPNCIPGADTSKWRWGSMHKASFKHAFADVPVLGKVRIPCA